VCFNACHDFRSGEAALLGEAMATNTCVLYRKIEGDRMTFMDRSITYVCVCVYNNFRSGEAVLLGEAMAMNNV